MLIRVHQRATQPSGASLDPWEQEAPLHSSQSEGNCTLGPFGTRGWGEVASHRENNMTQQKVMSQSHGFILPSSCMPLGSWAATFKGTKMQ